MATDTDGWAWLEGPAGEEHGRREDGEEAVTLTFARCFATPDGQRVLAYLRRLTLERTVGPASPDAVLRYLEGQRGLVAHIQTLIARGIH
jgi:hypothetical protein